MRRTVVDTNCLLASLNRNSPFHHLYELFVSEAFEWILSNEILTEYEEVLTQHYSAATAQRVTEILLNAPIHHFRKRTTNGSSLKRTRTTTNLWT